MNVPKSLRIWFLIHFFIDLIFSIPIFLFPVQIMNFFGWPSIDPYAARVMASAFMAIGGTSLIAIRAGAESYRSLLTLKIIWSLAAITGISISIIQGFPFDVAALGLGIFIFLSIVWIYYRLRLA